MDSRKDVLKNIIGDKEDCRLLIQVPIPVVTMETITKNRKTCATNKCKCYNTSWTCPPNCGTEKFCINKISGCKDADVYIHTFKNIDFNNEEQLNEMMDSFRNECRNIMIECRKRGFDVFALADGPCKYCKRCAVLDGKTCYHPDMQVPSVSGYGLDMTAYMGSLGEEFTFSDNSVSLYGIFLYK